MVTHGKFNCDGWMPPARYEVRQADVANACAWAPGDGFAVARPCSTGMATHDALCYRIHRAGGRSLTHVLHFCRAHARDWALQRGVALPEGLTDLEAARAERDAALKVLSDLVHALEGFDHAAQLTAARALLGLS